MFVSTPLRKGRVDRLPRSDDPGSRASLLARLRLFVSPIFYLSQNPLSLVGVVIATSLFFTLLVFYLANFYGVGGNPYVGIIAYLILPGIFFLGLILIPLGMILKHRRESRQEIGRAHV